MKVYSMNVDGRALETIEAGGFTLSFENVGKDKCKILYIKPPKDVITKNERHLLIKYLEGFHNQRKK